MLRSSSFFRRLSAARPFVVRPIFFQSARWSSTMATESPSSTAAAADAGRKAGCSKTTCACFTVEADAAKAAAADEAKRSKRQKAFKSVVRFFGYIGAAAAVGGASFVVWKEIEDRKKRASRDLQAVIIRGLSQKYVPPPLPLEGADDLIGSAETTKKLNRFDGSSSASILVINGPPDFGLVEAVRKHYAGRAGIIDLTNCYAVSMFDLVRAFERMAPELQLYAAMYQQSIVLAETAAVLKKNLRGAVQPTVLLKPQSSLDNERIIDLTKELEKIGFRVVLIADFPVNTNIKNAIARSTQEYVVNDAANRADKAAKAERYLLSDKSRIAKRFTDPADAKLIAEAVGADFYSIYRFIDYMERNPSKTARGWLDDEIAEAHRCWMAAVLSIPNFGSDRIKRLVEQMTFNADGLCQPDTSYKNRDIIKHLAGRGVVWNPFDSDYEAFASPIYVAAWKTHTAKKLQL
jgi:hypothetical protein